MPDLNKFEKTTTQQNYKDSCDVNTIVERANATGILPSVNAKIPRYEDVSNIPDYQAALNIVIKAERLFDSLPSKIRERFSNDPQEMVEFVQDPANYEEAVRLGIVNEKLKEATKPEPEPIKKRQGNKDKEDWKSKDKTEDLPLE